MVARVLKEEMNVLLRKTMEEYKIPLKVPFRSAVVSFINEFIVPTDLESSQNKVKGFWRITMKSMLEAKFPFCLSELELSNRHDLRKDVYPTILFQRFQEITAITISPQLLDELEGIKTLLNVHFTVLPSDIVAVGANVKHLNVIDEAEAKMLTFEAIQSNTSRTAKLWITVNRKFEAALSSNTACYRTLVDWANSLLLQAQQQLRHDSAFELLRAAKEKAKTAVC